MKNRIREEDVSARAKTLVFAGLKSHREGLLPHEEKGKCDAAKHVVSDGVIMAGMVSYRKV